MKKNYERYFTNNLATAFYIAGAAMVVVGLIGIFFWEYVLIMAALVVVGLVLFFITVPMKITDKDYDMPKNHSFDSYKKEHIEGKTIDRKMLDPEQFDLFSGYLFDQPDIKRKVGRDGVLRSSRYYVAALKASRTGFMIFYSEYDMLSGESNHRFIQGQQGDLVGYQKAKEKPAMGDYRYLVSVEKDGSKEKEELLFHLPDDALVDTKMHFIENMAVASAEQPEPENGPDAN